MDHNISVQTGGFAFFLSSRRLLKFAAQALTINVDTSCKLKWHGSSVLFVGVSDARGEFFPVMFSVLSSETNANYVQLLKTLKRCVEAITSSEFRPLTYVGNGDVLLNKAMGEVFPETRRRVCWLHTRKEIATQLRRHEREAQSSFEKDIAALQLSCDQQQFEVSSLLMLEKWRRQWPTSGFIDFFEEHFLADNATWFEGFDDVSYSTNKKLASITNEVRNRHTFREQLPLERFLHLAVALVREWSVRARQTGELVRTVEADEGLLKAACQLQKRQKTMVNDGNAIYIPSGDRTLVTVDEVATFETQMHGDADSFDAFIALRMSLWKVVDLADKSDLSQLRCTCPTYLQRKMCEHVLAIGAAYSLFELPQSVWNALPDTPDGKRKRGRPRKHKPAAELTF
ncbi:uncharacterized protein LOC119099095 isoform X2 [Pollicipes pollicipes]|nr:uncharacterized protein LOC119099095 isoform X2 [Pollicipes pollicipes]